MIVDVNNSTQMSPDREIAIADEIQNFKEYGITIDKEY